MAGYEWVLVPHQVVRGADLAAVLDELAGELPIHVLRFQYCVSIGSSVTSNETSPALNTVRFTVPGSSGSVPAEK